MLRVVADTNVLISAVIANGKPRQFLRGCIAGEWRLVSSPALMGEFAQVLRRPKFSLTDDSVYRALGALVGVAELVDPQVTFHVIADDPDDDAVLEAAFEGKAAYIVSGDRHLLSLKPFEGIEILSVATFLVAARKWAP